MLLSAGGDIDAVESADFIAQEPKLRQLKSLNDERGGTLLSFFKLQDEDSQQNMSSAILGALFRNLMFHQPGQAVGSSITPAMQRLAKRRSEVYDGAAVVKAATDEIFKRYLDQMQVCDCPRLVAVMASLITEARGIVADGNDVRLIGTIASLGSARCCSLSSGISQASRGAFSSTCHPRTITRARCVRCSSMR